MVILAALGVSLGSGGAGASVQRPADIRTTVTIGGPAVTVTLDSGAKAYLTFSGSSGQNLGLGLTGSSIVCCGATVKLRNPSGTQIGSVGFATSPVGWNLPKLTTTGTYTLLVDPGTKTGSVKLTLSKDIVGGSIVVGGASATATIARAGQNERFTFSATSGRYLGIGLTSNSFACCTAAVKLLNPSGMQISSIGFATSPLDWDLPVLTASGTYTLLVDPGALTGSVTLTLSQDIAGGAIVTGGASPTVTISRVGQNERFAFSGTSGQNLGLGLTGTTFACCANNTVKVLNPSGSQIGSVIFGASPADWNLPTLTATGTYTMIVDPGPNTGSTTLTLSADIVGTIASGGASVNATFARPGQNERLTFSGTTGENLGIGLTGTTFPCCVNNWVRVFNPSGTQLDSLIFGPSPTDRNLPTLIATGTYTVLIDPGPNTGSTTLTLSDDIVGTIVQGGNPVTATFARAGQNERLTFSGAAGETLGLGLTGTTFACCVNNYVRLLDPVGTQITSIIFGGSSGADWNLPILTISGTYTLLVDPGPNTGSTTLTFSDDLVQPVSIGGSPASLTFGVGQNARFAFTGSSGQTLSFSISNNSIPFFQVMLLNSGGTQVGGTGSFGSGSVTWAVPTLPASGNYTIFFEPHTSAGTATFSLTPAGAPVNISNPAVSGILEDGEIVTASPGTWSNPPTSFAYQWQRCIDGTCSDIADAAQNTYTLVDDDINSTMKVIVNAANSYGSSVDASPQTALPVRFQKFSHSTSACSDDYEDPINFLVDYPRIIWTQIPFAGPPFPTFDLTSGQTGGLAAGAIARMDWHDGAGSSDSWALYRYNGLCVNQDTYATSSPIPGSGSHVRFWISTQGRRPIGATHRDYPCEDFPSDLYFTHGSNDYVESAIELADFFYSFVDENGYQAHPIVAIYRDRDPTPDVWSCGNSSPDDGFTQEIDYRGTDILHVFGP